ncbi:MAG TPA: hypothetical protein VFH52_04250 [Rhodanobacteraceae bacterium]|nr:hypothetical protein [Rhodanobacteraceae bacterium]
MQKEQFGRSVGSCQIWLDHRAGFLRPILRNQQARECRSGGWVAPDIERTPQRSRRIIQSAERGKHAPGHDMGRLPTRVQANDRLQFIQRAAQIARFEQDARKQPVCIGKIRNRGNHLHQQGARLASLASAQQ